MEYKVLCSIVVFYPKNNATDEKVVSETKTGWGRTGVEKVKCENGKVKAASKRIFQLSERK